MPEFGAAVACEPDQTEDAQTPAGRMHLLSQYLPAFGQPDETLHECPICEGELRKSAFKKCDAVFSQCRRCGFLFWNPRFSDSRLKEFRRSEYWRICVAGRSNGPSYHLPDEALTWIAERLKESIDVENATLIDVGCGTGGLLLYLRNTLGCDARGIDIDTSLEELWKLHNVPATVRELEDVVLNNECYDIVVCSEVVEHVSRPAEFFARLSGIVAAGGRLILTCPNMGRLSPRLLNGFINWAWPPNHINFPTRRTMEILAEQNGLALKHWTTVGNELFSWNNMAKRYSYVMDHCAGFPDGRGGKTVVVPKAIWNRGCDETLRYLKEAVAPVVTGRKRNSEVEEKYKVTLARVTRALMWLRYGFGFRRLVSFIERKLQEREGRERILAIFRKP